MIADARAIQAALRQHAPVPDEEFDAIYPRMSRFRSGMHWTPVDVAMRVAQLLAPSPERQVLDVGAGVGKACIIGALMTDVTWSGVERNPSMVAVATRAARELGVEHRTRFIVGEAMLIDWEPYGGIYLYNPFAESLFTAEVIDPGDRRQRYLDEVDMVQRKLQALRPDTRVVTYHGFGGTVPEGFELAEREKIREDEVCLWIRRGAAVRTLTASET